MDTYKNGFSVKKVRKITILAVNKLKSTCIYTRFQLVAAVCLVGGLFVKFGSDDLKSLLPDLMRELVRKIDPILRGK